MSRKDYYNTLGIESNSSTEAIKKHIEVYL